MDSAPLVDFSALHERSLQHEIGSSRLCRSRARSHILGGYGSRSQTDCRRLNSSLRSFQSFQYPRYSRGMLVFNYVTPTETALRLVPSVKQRGAAAEATRIYYFPRYFTRSQ